MSSVKAASFSEVQSALFGWSVQGGDALKPHVATTLLCLGFFGGEILKVVYASVSVPFVRSDGFRVSSLSNVSEGLRSYSGRLLNTAHVQICDGR